MEWKVSKKTRKSFLGTAITEISLAAFVSLFLDGVSETSVETAVAAGLNTFGKLKDAGVQDYMRICGFRESNAILVKYGILEHEKEMKEFIARGGFRLVMQPRDNAPGAALTGYSFCFTGPLETMKRTEAREKVSLLGGVTLDYVKYGLSFLVTNNTESGSSKSKKRAAKDSGVIIINEDEFSDIINNPGRAGFYFSRGCPPSAEQTGVREKL